MYYTSLEQAKRLVDAGLDAKTADMYYEQESDTLCGDYEWRAKVGTNPAIQNDLFSYRQGYTKPCWSVGRLIDWLKEHLQEISQDFELRITQNGVRLLADNNDITYNTGDLTENCVEMVCHILLALTKTSKTSPNPKVLVVVDCQYDFVNPDGSLFVKGSEDLPERIAGIMERFDGVVLTMDAHPYNHCSFKENGGQWPAHCIAFSKGASIPDVILNSVADAKITPLFVKKGGDCFTEEYSAFDNIFNCDDLGYFLSCYLAENDGDKVDFYVCGVAGDYCVKETTKDLCNLSNEPINNVFIIKDMCPCIDTAFDMETFAKNCGARTVLSNDFEK